MEKNDYTEKMRRNEANLTAFTMEEQPESVINSKIKNNSN